MLSQYSFMYAIWLVPLHYLTGSGTLFDGVRSILKQYMNNDSMLISNRLASFETNVWSMISPTLTSRLSQRRQFGLNCKKNVALKFTSKIVALFTENYPSLQLGLWANKYSVFASIACKDLSQSVSVSHQKYPGGC